MKYLIYFLITIIIIGCGADPKPLEQKEVETQTHTKNQKDTEQARIENLKNAEFEIIKFQIQTESIKVSEVEPISSNGGRIMLVDTSKYIHFDTGKYHVRNASKLKEIIKELKDNKYIYFYIVGHTDSSGTDKYNQLLSEMRAREVYKAFLALNFDKSKVDYIGYGEEQPISTNGTRYGRATNRRVELIISNKPNLSQRFLKNRIINIAYLNNHNNINPGQVEISTKGLTKNKSEQELRKLQAEIQTPKRKSFDINIKKRRHYISTSS